jgi:hypothetical protein
MRVAKVLYLSVCLVGPVSLHNRRMGRLLTRRRDNDRYVCKLSRIDSQIMQVGFSEVNVERTNGMGPMQRGKSGRLA